MEIAIMAEFGRSGSIWTERMKRPSASEERPSRTWRPRSYRHDGIAKCGAQWGRRDGESNAAGITPDWLQFIRRLYLHAQGSKNFTAMP
jgi:hypothetical protein